MARKQREKAKVETGAWLNTYADMVTLLLCFFVLLYSMSTIDSQKWEYLIKSLNPNAALQSPIQTEEGPEDNLPAMQLDKDELDEDEAPRETFEQLEELYRLLKQYVESEGLEESIEIQKGEGLVFLTFHNNIFFEGDRYELRTEGIRILDVLAAGMDGLDDYIGEVRILGHTTQVDPGRDNDIMIDRRLAANRAVEVLVYLQEKNVLDARKFISVGYGQHFPISPVDTEENRAKNRRVEIIILQNDDTVNVALDAVYEELGIGADIQSGLTGAGAEGAAAGADNS